MKTILLSVVIAMTCVVNAVSGNLNDFAYNSEVNGNRVETQTVYKVVNKKYLKHHLKYSFTYDVQNRVTSKEVLKWNIEKEAYEKQYCLNFIYENNETTVEFALWNGKEQAYNEIKSKAIYQINRDGINYQSYEWNQKENDWNLVTEHNVNREEIKLLANK